jgi:hypothetical protein
MDRIAYFIKYKLKSLFPIVEAIAFLVVFIRYFKKRRRALSKALISGTFSDTDCTIRALTSLDTRVVSEFLQQSSKDHLKYFKPHEFDELSVRKVLTSTSFMTYGLFLEDRLIAYALLRLAPNGTAYIGRAVNSEFSGRGIGKYLSRYLYWQASCCGFRPRSTISKLNLASIKSHESVTSYKVIAELPNDYLMLEFEVNSTTAPPLKL